MNEFNVPNRHERRKNPKQANVNLADLSKAKTKVKKADKEPLDLTEEMKRALMDNDEDALVIATDKVLNNGWTQADLINAFEAHRLNILMDHVKQRVETQKKGNNILMMN